MKKVLFLLIIIILLIVVFNMRYLFNKNITYAPYNLKGYDDLKRDRYNFTSGGIPKIIFKTSWHKRDNLPTEIINVLEKTKRLNPDYEIYYFDNDDCDRFIQDFDENVNRCYKKIIPGAFKADIFRMCMLYQYGGIYSDIGHDPYEPYDTILKDDVNVVLVNNYFGISTLKNYSGVEIAFMCSIPKYSFFKEVINKFTYNITNDYYGDSPLDITGPIMVGKVYNCYFEDVCDNQNKNLMEKDVFYDSNGYKIKLLKMKLDPYFVFKILDSYTSRIHFYDNDTLLFASKFKNYHNVMYSSKKSKRYSQLWSERKIYKN